MINQNNTQFIIFTTRFQKSRVFYFLTLNIILHVFLIFTLCKHSHTCYNVYILIKGDVLYEKNQSYSFSKLLII